MTLTENPTEQEASEPQEDAERRTRFGDALLRFRLDRRLSQAELGKRSSVSSGYIGLIETGLRGTKISYTLLMRISAALELNAEELMVFLRAADLSSASALTVGDVIPYDPTLSDEQKVALLGLYSVLSAESAASTG